MRPPIIAFANNSRLAFCHETLEEVSHANMKGLKERPYDGMRIVDSDLCAYTVHRARIRSGRGPFGGYNIWINREVIVDLDFEPESKEITLEELKAMIRERLTQDSIEEFYEVEQGQFEHRLEHATNFYEVCSMLRGLP